MKTRTLFKPKTILALLLAVAVIDVLSLLLFTRVDTIVHTDLYNYGLQFNYAWAGPYWNYSNLFQSSLIIVIILIGISMASFAFYVRKHNAFLIVTCYMSLAAGTILMLFSTYLFYGIDSIVNNDLYLFGLSFSYIWAQNYWTYARLMLALIGLGGAATITSLILIFIGTQKPAKITPIKLTYSSLITTGTITIITSIIYASSILAFIGLGLLFWGIIFAYIRREEYVKTALLDVITHSYIVTINEIIHEMACEGNAIYLPPSYFSDPEAYKVYVPEQKEAGLPPREYIQKQDPKFLIAFIENPPAVLLTPPGAELAKLFEKTLQTNFAEVGLQYLQKNIPKVFIEDLEIAKNFKMETENNKIHVKIENSVYKALNVETEKPSSTNFLLGSPLSSSIACALAKSTGKPIIIEKQQTSKDGRDLTIEYRIVEEEEQTEP